ncbi:MAG TPA: hypothetical protein VEZ14_10015 [Dehalococcoidia bacterium]|nr:hypothetical protein [Dehalococcoidia bacterium]
MAKARSTDKAKAKAPKRKMTREEILAFNAKLAANPKIQKMIEEGIAAFDRGEGVRFSELKRRHAGR